MEQLILERPNEKQKLFLAAKEKHIGFGGARGGGKSWVVRDKAKRLCLHYPGIKLLILRRTYPELQNNHIAPLQAELGDLVQYNSTEKVFRFPNGSTIRFGYCNADRDLLRYQGAEFDVIFLDEATQLQEIWIKQLTACVRGANRFPKRIYYTCNPGGPSHGYFKRLFLDRRYEPGERAADYRFIQSLVTDNQALLKAQPDYIRQLEALPPKLRDAWLHGKWDVCQGKFFDNFRQFPDGELCAQAGITPEEAIRQHRFTHVIEPFDLGGERRGWTLMRSYDFGYNKPFSMGYWAMDYDGVLYRIAEFYGCTQTPDEGVRWAPDEQFRRIRRFEQEHPLLRGRQFRDSVADPAIWDQSRGESIAETAMRYGIYFTPGDNNRIPGWMQVHYRLRFDENGYARLYAFDTCKAFIRTMQLQMFSETNPEDLNTRLEDHCPDEVRYMCMARPVQPARQETAAEQMLYADPLGR